MREPGTSLTRLTDVVARRGGEDPAVLADDRYALQASWAGASKAKFLRSSTWKVLI